MARSPPTMLTNPMQPPPHSAMPASRAMAASRDRWPSCTALPKTTADRSPRAAARASSPSSASSPTPSSTTSTGPSISSSDATHGRPKTPSYRGLTRCTAGADALRSTSVTSRSPKLPGRAVAPTTATDRAPSIAWTASVVVIGRGEASGRRAADGPASVALVVADRRLRGLPTRDAAYAATRMRCGARVVEPCDRRAVVGVTGSRPHVEQLLHRQLAVEDVATDEAVLVLELVRPDDVAVQDRALDVGRDLGVAVDHPVGIGLEVRGVWLRRPVRRHPLREQRHHVVPFRHQRLVERRRDHPVAEWSKRCPAITRVLESRLHVLHRRRHLDRPRVVLLLVRAGVGGEVRELRESEVDLHHAAAGLPLLDVAHEGIGQVRRAYVFQERR